MFEHILSQRTSAAAEGRRPSNWPLWIGSALVVVILLLAVFGPSLALRDPREHNLIIQVGDTWLTPPYPAFTPGFPLGSDNLGRDLFSWLLWSIRPTMVLVLVVASLRMALGLIIGVISGWSDRWAGKAADGLISAALAVPALIAALIVITAIGFRLGVWAFVVGLSVTGWAETAQLVRERTRTVRGQDAVEASRALGASKPQIFLLHILPQVMPMIWMLLAFEISNTLVTTAGLGFLGYYLGGAVFTEVDDFVYQRISEMPELGQMLATAWMVLDEPWAMVAASSVVFLIVLAFNLIGEGLQARLTRKLGGARGFYLKAAGGVVPWFDDHIGAPLAALTRRRGLRWAFVALFIVLAAGGVWLSRSQNDADPEVMAAIPGETSSAAAVDDGHRTETLPSGEPQDSLTSAFPVPGGHIWANEGHDPWRSRWLEFSGPVTTTVQWTLQADGAFTGGPAIDAGGTLYVALRSPSSDTSSSDDSGSETDASDGPPSEGTPSKGTLYALDGEGQVLWELSLPERPVGGPALDAAGTIYVADKSGVSAASPTGELLWHFLSPDGKPSTAGPMVAPDGAVYLKTSTALLAVGSDGTLLWQRPMTETQTSTMPHLSADGTIVYWEGLSFDRTDGSPVVQEWAQLSDPSAVVQVVIGADGRQYLRDDVRLLDTLAVQPVTGDSESLSHVTLDVSELTWQGFDAGVTPDGRSWISARPSVGGMGMGFYWGSATGTLSSKINLRGMRNIRVLAVDREGVAYACMDSYESEPACVALSPEMTHPLWRLPFGGVTAIAGASLAPGRLYVATLDGELFALGDAEPAVATLVGDVPSSIDAETGVPVFGPEPLWDRPAVPGDHPWPMPRHDAWGTLWTDVTGPGQAVERWVLEREGGFSGGPVVAADGSLYVGTPTGSLLALDPAGELLWQADLPTGIVGSPAIGGDGTVYVTDQGAYLTALTPLGEQLWRYHPTGVLTHTRRNASGQVLKEEVIPLDGLGPAGAGPIVAPDGTIYYSMAVDTYRHEVNVFFRSEIMVAVSPDGVGLLDELPYIWSDRLPARLSPDAHWILWGTVGIAPTPTSLAHGASPAPYADYVASRFEDNQDPPLITVTGADGRAYFVEKRSLTSWYLTPNTLVRDLSFEWTPEDSPGTAADGGATASGVRWLSFRNGKFIWITAEEQVVGPVRFPMESQLVGLDAGATAYGCGSSLGRPPECMAFALLDYESQDGEAEPLWLMTLAEGDEVLGGALAPGVLYVTTNADRIGRLYALGD